jgi:CII-binding regulator of phage lambda lysogenization HflD
MAAAPQYGKQYIRFAETGLVADNLAIPQFRVVQVTGATDPVSITNVFAGVADAAQVGLGVLQQEFNTTASDLGTDLLRLGTVATSGLLLIEQDAANALAAGDVLTIDAEGRASNAAATNYAPTFNGGTGIVRQVVTIGGGNFALVSIS